MQKIDSVRDEILGIQGANRQRVIQYDVSDWLTGQGEEDFTVIVKRPGEQNVYNAENVTVDADGVLTWTITSVETAIPGHGEAEICMTCDGAIYKSRKINTLVIPCIDGTVSPTPDDPVWWQDVAKELQEQGEYLIGLAEQVKDATEQYRDDAAQSAAEAAQSAAEAADSAHCAYSATRLATPRTISITGEASGSTLFDGSQDVEIVTAIETLTNLELEELLV